MPARHTGAAPPERDLSLQLRRNLGGLLTGELAYGRSGERGAHGRLHLSSSAATGPHQLRLGVTLAHGNGGDLYDQQGYRLGLGAAGPQPQRRRRWVDIDRLVWTVGWGDVDFTLGRWADDLEAAAYPANRLAPYDLNEPTLPRIQSRWALTAEVYLGDRAYKVAFYPFFIPSKRPTVDSAWSRDRAGDFYFAGTDPQNLGEVRPTGPAQSLLSFGYRSRRRGWDWGWGLDWGPDQYPVLTAGRDGAATRRYRRKTYLSAHTESPRAPLALYGQAVAQTGGGDDRFLAFGLGLKIRRRALVLETVYRREWIVQRAGGADLLASSRQARWGRDDLGLQAGWESGAFEARAGLHRLLGAGSYRTDAEIGWRRSRLGWRLRAEAFGGEKGYYGHWRRNDRLLLVLEYRR